MSKSSTIKQSKSDKNVSQAAPTAAAETATVNNAPVKKAPIRKGPRRLRPPKYRSLRLQKRIRHPVVLPSAWQLSKQSLRLLWQYKKLFVGIVLIYGILNLLLVQGLGGGVDVTSLKHNLDQVFTGKSGAIGSSLAIFAVLVGNTGTSNNNTSSGYQLVLLVMVSLACVWALRQVLSGTKVRIRDAYYRGMYPFVPFVLVLMTVALQLLPLLIGAGVYNLVTTIGIAVYPVERLLWGVLFALLALLSLYLITSSLFALYIVTLPDMTPMKALRSARALVRNRRWTILRKVLFLPVLLLIVAALIMVPVISLIAPLAQWVFYFLTMLAVAAIHAYMYTLYRELLRE